MSVQWQGTALLAPIAADNPCGADLEDTALLASFDAFRLYGRSTSLDAGGAGDEADAGPKTLEARDAAPDWGDLKSQSLSALEQSKDLRLLAYLSAALLRTDGLAAFADSLSVASQWLDTYWDQTYPRVVDGDGIFRRNALNCFTDPMAIVDRLRRVPIVQSRQHGVFSLRDVEVATGQAQPAKDGVRPDEAQINAAFAVLPLEQLTDLSGRVAGGVRALKAIDERMRTQFGAEAAPDFGQVSGLLAKIDKVLRAQLAARPSVAMGADEGSEAAGESRPFTGVIRSREEAVRALEAVADYFVKNEPSSPVPLICNRAKGLVSRGFLEVLEDIAPEAVKQARAAGGLKD